MPEHTQDITALILALCILISNLGGILTRSEKGIGWQYIRFSVITTSLPLLGILALNGTIKGDVVVPIIAAAMAYSFGRNFKE